MLNVIAGPSDELGAALVSHPDIDKIAFTGSSKVGGVVCSFGSCATGEVLPTSTRTMKFQVTARDNRVGGGGVVSAPVTITVGKSVLGIGLR